MWEALLKIQFRKDQTRNQRSRNTSDNNHMFYLSLDTSEHQLTLWKNPSISVNNPISLRKARSPAKTPGRLHRHSHGGRTEPSGWASQRPHQEPMTCQWPNDPMTKNYKDVWCFIYSNILWSLLHKSAWKHGWWPILLSKNPKSGFAGTTSPANTWFDPCRIGAECGVLKRVKEPRNFGAVACLDGYSNAMFFCDSIPFSSHSHWLIPH